jgi:hypothetical protein
MLEDRAALALACAELHIARQSPQQGSYLEVSRELLTMAVAEHAGDAKGQWFDAPSKHDELFVRGRATHDGAMPSGTSLLLHACAAMARAGDNSMLNEVLAAIRVNGSAITGSPVGSANSVRAVLAILKLGGDAATKLREGAPAMSRESAEDQTVEVWASVDRVALSREGPATFQVALRIAPGYMVTSAFADDEVALRVGVLGGSGVRIYADYPAGERKEAHGHSVYTGDVSFDVVLEREGELKGKPIVAIRYQSCSDHACAAPRVLELDIAIDVV